jgi:hypothetical protein
MPDGLPRVRPGLLPRSRRFAAGCNAVGPAIHRDNSVGHDRNAPASLSCPDHSHLSRIPAVPDHRHVGDGFPVLDPRGDTLLALAHRFDIEPGQIACVSPLSVSGYLPAGLAMQIPNTLETISAGGHLSRHTTTMEDSTTLTDAAIVQRVPEENSVSPRLLLVLLESRSGWAFGGAPANADAQIYPLGFSIPDRKGLYQELSVAATQLSRGYYG